MTKLDEIIETFQFVEPPMRLELLLDYANNLPPLPESLKAKRDAGLGRVHECQSPVFVFPEVENDAVALHAWAPNEAPTARAFVSLLIDALDGAAPSDVAVVPDDLLNQLGIGKQLGMTRQQGLAGVLYRVKHGVAQAQKGEAQRDAA
ncbi:MAG: SufE family protein [Bacteroidota bacterium]